MCTVYVCFNDLCGDVSARWHYFFLHKIRFKCREIFKMFKSNRRLANCSMHLISFVFEWIRYLCRRKINYLNLCEFLEGKSFHIIRNISILIFKVQKISLVFGANLIFVRNSWTQFNTIAVVMNEFFSVFFWISNYCND